MKVNDLNKLVRTDEEVDNQLLDVMIIAGCHELIKIENFNPTKEELRHIASKDYDDEMKEFLLKLEEKEKQKSKRQKAVRFKNVILKVSACLACLLIVSIVTVSSSEAAQVVFLNTYIKVFDIKTDFVITSDDEQLDSDKEIIQFGYIPSGFEATEIFDNEDLYMATFENSDDEFIIIKITQESSVTLDSEGANVTIQNFDGKECYIYEENEEKTIFFVDNGQGYVISSKIKMEEIEKIIKNIK